MCGINAAFIVYRYTALERVISEYFWNIPQSITMNIAFNISSRDIITFRGRLHAIESKFIIQIYKHSMYSYAKPFLHR